MPVEARFFGCTVKLLWFQRSGSAAAPRAKLALTQTLQPLCPKSHSSLICQRIQSRKHIKVESLELPARMQACVLSLAHTHTHTNTMESLTNYTLILYSMIQNESAIRSFYQPAIRDLDIEQWCCWYLQSNHVELREDQLVYCLHEHHWLPFLFVSHFMSSLTL